VTAATQTLWAELIAGTLADAGITVCVVSPGSRSTPLVAALAADKRLALPTIIDERAAAFYALGVARATGTPCALVCTSGSAAAHYLPAIVEASHAGVPLFVLTADRPPELQQCGASQTIDQRELYGRFVRGAFDLGAPTGSALAFRAVRRAVVQAITLASGPAPGPVHINVPLRKPLEPALPNTDEERALARVVADIRRTPVRIAPPMLAADRAALDELAAAILAEPRGIIVAGALGTQHASRDAGATRTSASGHDAPGAKSAQPSSALRDAAFGLSLHAAYPLLAEAGSQLRFGPRPAALMCVDHFDLLFGAQALASAPAPKLIVQLGAEPVAQGWSTAQSLLATAQRWVLTDREWHDPDGTARGVIVGDLAASLAYLAERIAPRDDLSFATTWRALDGRIAGALDRAVASHPRSETAVMRALLDAVPDGAIVQVGNSLPIRIIDHARGGGRSRAVITQRGAAGIDGLVASAAGATRAGKPVVLVLGDVSFAHDLSGLLAARAATGPLAIVVLDNGGGRIFNGLPIARTASPAMFAEHFVTAPSIDPAAIAVALGARGVTAASPAAVASAVTAALATVGPTVIHAPVTATGAHDVRRDALEHLATTSPLRQAATISAGVTHV
jgi:2-succinyl-5-enolpyruvyl-6-hydroxy-3-cyclohexene-1-carboxylate synthase